MVSDSTAWRPALFRGPASGPCLVLDHGAGTAMDWPFMTAMAEALAGPAANIAVAARTVAGFMARLQSRV